MTLIRERNSTSPRRGSSAPCFAGWFALLVCYLPVQAQFNITWWTVDGGGTAEATGGPLRLQGTIGQPDAGPAMIGGPFRLSGGFWFSTAAAPPIGACCQPDGTCTLTEQAGCSAPGVWHGEWTMCVPNLCPPPGTGACCYGTDTCVVTHLTDCQNVYSGTYLGDGTDCDPNPCTLTGACCLPSGGCASDVTAEDCTTIYGGTYQGNGTTCTPGLCQYGACCFTNGTCQELSWPECSSAGGSFQWPSGTTCMPDACLYGACCHANGSCAESSQTSCVYDGGFFQGEGTECDPNPCEPTGACCLPSGGCASNVTEDDCTTVWGGTYQGDETTCAAGLCQHGACCFLDGTCQELSYSDCTSTGGSFQWPSGTTCMPGACLYGACCFEDGSCEERTQTVCTYAGGSFQGEGTVCSPNPCPQPDVACCFQDGSCQMLTAADCTGQGGTPQGYPSTCSPNPCPQPTGACCLTDGDCQVLTQSACSSAGGSYQGNGTSCTPNPCMQQYCAAAGNCEWTSIGLIQCGTIYNWLNWCSPYIDFTNLSTEMQLGGSYSLYVQTRPYDPSNWGVWRVWIDWNRDGVLDNSGPELIGEATGGISGHTFPISVPSGAVQGATVLRIRLSMDYNTAPCGSVSSGTVHDYRVVLVAPPGACCFQDGSCQMLTAPNCTAQGGTPQGYPSTCSPNPCPQPAACCYANGSCAVTTQANCPGVWHPEWPNCSVAQCPQPTGACCVANGTCQALTESACSGAGGLYQGDGTDCTSNPCAVINYAWWSDEVDQDADGCPIQARLNWDPYVTGCDGTLTVFEKVCRAPISTGVWELVTTTSPHVITDCLPSDALYVTVVGTDACTWYDWKIEIYRSGQSSPDYARSPLNDAQLNDYNLEVSESPVTVACCFPSGLCTMLTAAECTAAGGDPDAYGSDCTPNECPACIGDLNCDGAINFGDINPFVLYLSNFAGWQTAYAGCNPVNGDINGDGAYGASSFGDINPFVALMTECGAGCTCPGPGSP